MSIWLMFWKWVSQLAMRKTLIWCGYDCLDLETIFSHRSSHQYHFAFFYWFVSLLMIVATLYCTSEIFNWLFSISCFHSFALSHSLNILLSDFFLFLLRLAYCSNLPVFSMRRLKTFFNNNISCYKTIHIKCNDFI